MTEMQDPAQSSTGLTEADVRGTMIAALRMLGVLSVVAAGLFWWRAGWQSAALLVVGSVISATSLWEYLRLMTAMNRSMDKGHAPRPMGLVAFGFILRLVLTVAVLYVSLKHLHGTVLALAAGIGLGLVSLVYQAFRLIRRPVA